MSVFLFKERLLTEITLTDRWLNLNINKLVNLTKKPILIVDINTNKILRKLNVSKGINTETFPYNVITKFRLEYNFNSEYPSKYHIVEKEKQLEMATSNHLIYSKDFIELEDVTICFTFAYSTYARKKSAAEYTSNAELHKYRWYDYTSRLGTMDINSGKSLKYTLHNEGHYYRIRATKDIPSKGITKGTWGGLVLCKSNLSHFGTCWIYESGAVTKRNSRIFGNASIYGLVQGSAEIGQGVVIGPKGKILNNTKNVLDVNFNSINEYVVDNIIKDMRVDTAINWYKETSTAYLININLPIVNSCNIKSTLDIHIEEDYIFNKINPYDSARYNTQVTIPYTVTFNAQAEERDPSSPGTFVDYLNIACNRPNPPIDMCLRAILKIYCKNNIDTYNNVLAHNTPEILKNQIIKIIS